MTDPSLPMCSTCGIKPVKVHRYYTSEYCSRECCYRSPTRIAKIKAKQRGKPRPYASERMRDPKVQAHMRQQIKVKHGVDNVSQLPDVKAKKRQTFNANHPTPEAKGAHYEKGAAKRRWTHSDEDLQRLMETNHYDVVATANTLGVAFSTLYNHIHRINKQDEWLNQSRSRHEVKVTGLFESLDIDVVKNDRTLIKPLELDLVLPHHNIAIEVNGMFWHSRHNSRYHLIKHDQCQAAGIRLMQFWDSEIDDHWDRVSSVIKNAVHHNAKRVYARQCQVVELDGKRAAEFIQANHIQGAGQSPKIALGLMHEDVLVSAMTFSPARYSKQWQWELLRYCSTMDTGVIGGAAKLFKHFEALMKPVSVMSYCDKRLFTGGLYKTLGFSHHHDSSPNYWYFRSNEYWPHSRVRFQKHKLHQLLEEFNPEQSEAENMRNHGWLRVFDCGNQVWVKTGY